MAIRDLDQLMQALDVSLQPGLWRFECRPDGDQLPAEAIMMFREAEGTTLVLPASSDTPHDNRWSWIEVSVLSDLNAVGFLARLARALADADIPCNAVAGFHHDHIFVPEPVSEEAVAALIALREVATL